jgi:hypothetical protein
MNKLTLAVPAVALVALLALRGSSRAAPGQPHFGLYRGVVVANQDPMQVARLQVSVPSVATGALWAMPCVPYAGGAAPALPPVGAKIWVEYEGGDTSYPVWLGVQVDAGGLARPPSGATVRPM